MLLRISFQRCTFNFNRQPKMPSSNPFLRKSWPVPGHLLFTIAGKHSMQLRKNDRTVHSGEKVLQIDANFLWALQKQFQRLKKSCESSWAREAMPVLLPFSIHGCFKNWIADPKNGGKILSDWKVFANCWEFSKSIAQVISMPSQKRPSSPLTENLGP